MKSRTLLIGVLSGAILTHPIDLYRIDVAGLPWSIPRLLILCAVILFSIGAVYNAIKLQRTNFNNLLIIYITVPVLLTIFRIDNTDILNNLLSAIVVFLIYQSPRELHNHTMLLRALQLSYLWYIVFAAYTYWFYFSYGVPLNDIPLRSVIPYNLKDVGHLEEGFLVNLDGKPLPRLALPLSSPPGTSVALALGIIVYLFSNEEKTGFMKVFRMIMGTLLILCLILTISKTGVVVLAFGLFMASVWYVVSYKTLRPSVVAGVCAVVIVVSVSMIVVATAGYEVIIARLLSWEAMANTMEEHFETRVEAINISSESATRLLFGVGVGNYGQYGMGQHSHSPITTNLVELGLIGSMFFWLIYVYAFYKAGTILEGIRIYKNEMRYHLKVTLMYFSGLCAILVSTIVYEALYIWAVYIFFGLSINWSIRSREWIWEANRAMSSSPSNLTLDKR